MMNSFLDQLSTVAASLSRQGRPLFSPPFQWVCLANGDADFHDNVIFFGFAGRGASPVIVAKVPRLARNGHMLKTEYECLVELRERLGAGAADYVPEAHALTDIQGRTVLLLSYVRGESLTRLSPRAFWRDRTAVEDLAREAARALRELNSRTAEPIAPGSRLLYGTRAQAEKFQELFELRADETRALSAAQELADRQAATATHRVLVQGDFWHGNMIREPKRGSLIFIDWQFARWSGDVSLDVYFFLLAGALAASGTGPADWRAQEACRLLEAWRAHVIPAYLSTYGTPGDYVLLPEREGMLLCCVEKATRPSLAFGYRHPDDQLWRMLFRELLRWPGEG